jgi:hypothetical protein
MRLQGSSTGKYRIPVWFWIWHWHFETALKPEANFKSTTLAGV